MWWWTRRLDETFDEACYLVDSAANVTREKKRNKKEGGRGWEKKLNGREGESEKDK